MDSDGYVPLITIVGFPKVQLLTNDIALISRILQNSKEVELDATGLKVRTKRNWERWLPSSQTAQLEAAEQNEKPQIDKAEPQMSRSQRRLAAQCQNF
uniref:HTH La-type RNA-binding domain-containing protein n=1 Tax=Ditylenchus dipsaci TaxID=166011 RepID=A0A915D2V9_9BILA